MWENFADLDRTFAAFDLMRRRMDQLAGFPRARDAESDTFFMKDTGDAYVLKAALPGVPAQAVELTVTGQVLKLRAARRPEAPAGFTAHRRERPAFDFARSVTLPARVDAERVVAEMKNGILTLTLPKAADAKPRSITVRAA